MGASLSRAELAHGAVTSHHLGRGELTNAREALHKGKRHHGRSGFSAFLSRSNLLPSPRALITVISCFIAAIGRRPRIMAWRVLGWKPADALGDSSKWIMSDREVCYVLCCCKSNWLGAIEHDLYESCGWRRHCFLCLQLPVMWTESSNLSALWTPCMLVSEVRHNCSFFLLVFLFYISGPCDTIYRSMVTTSDMSTTLWTTRLLHRHSAFANRKLWKVSKRSLQRI